METKPTELSKRWTRESMKCSDCKDHARGGCWLICVACKKPVCVVCRNKHKKTCSALQSVKEPPTKLPRGDDAPGQVVMDLEKLTKKGGTTHAP